jgi:DNA-binding transcriptional LysR family regulator
LITDSVDLMIRAALDGVGIGYTIEAYVEEFIATGQLAVVLEDYAPEFPGWFLYHPSRRQLPLPLKVFKAFLDEKFGLQSPAEESLKDVVQPLKRLRAAQGV